MSPQCEASLFSAAGQFCAADNRAFRCRIHRINVSGCGMAFSLLQDTARPCSDDTALYVRKATDLFGIRYNKNCRHGKAYQRALP